MIHVDLICFLNTQAMLKSEYNGQILEFTLTVGLLCMVFKTKPQKEKNNVKALAGHLIYMNALRFSSAAQFPTYNNVLKYSTYFNAEREFFLYYI